VSRRKRGDGGGVEQMVHDAALCEESVAVARITQRSEIYEESAAGGRTHDSRLSEKSGEKARSQGSKKGRLPHYVCQWNRES
jgi:hypothetical protein